MKVTHVASGDLWAGAEKQLVVLAEALEARGDVSVEAVVLNDGELASRLKQLGVPVLVLDERTTNPLALYRAIARQLRQSRPEIVHTHRTKENILGGTAAYAAGIPSLRTQHGASEWDIAGMDIRRRAIRRADHFVGRHIQSAVVAVSDLLASELCPRFGADRVVTIPNGLMPREASRPVPQGAQRWRIAVVGRLVPVKRVDLFLAMARWLAPRLPAGAAVEFLVVGDGPLRKQLEAAVTEATPVKFLGAVPDAETMMPMIDVLVLCSDHEGLPMVALEAMASGALVVTHRIGGLPDLLDHGRCGVLVPSQTPESFGQAILDLVNEPARAAELRKAAFQRIQNAYSAARMAEHYAALYANLVRGSAPKSARLDGART